MCGEVPTGHTYVQTIGTRDIARHIASRRICPCVRCLHVLAQAHPMMTCIALVVFYSMSIYMVRPTGYCMFRNASTSYSSFPGPTSECEFSILYSARFPYVACIYPGPYRFLRADLCIFEFGRSLYGEPDISAYL